MSEFVRRLRSLLHRRGLDRELEEEMRFHLEMHADENRDIGMDLEEARYAARRRFGNVALLKEVSREAWGWRWLDALGQDVRFALRILRKNSGFTAVAVLTLALGIGANTAVFSVVNAVLLRALPFPDSDRLMVLLSKSGDKEFSSAPGVFLDWRDRSTSFEQISGVYPTPKILSGRDQPRKCDVGAASFDFFRLLGVPPILGREFTAAEDQPGRDEVALLDEAFWRREFGGDPGVLGRTITLDGKGYAIVGVLPGGRRLATFAVAEVWVPLAANRQARLGGPVIAMGRLRRGTSRQAAQAEMDAVMRGIGAEHREDSKTGVAVRPLGAWVAGDTRTTFLVLLGAVVFVLLIGCANLATVLMARATVRQPEMAVRAALGAGRLRLMRQMLAESTLLAALGGALGLLLAVWAVKAVPAIRAFHVPRADEVTVDHEMLAFAAVISLLTGILFGLIPALETGRAELNLALKTRTLAARSSGRLRNALVIAQVALSLVLLSGAGLLLNSFLRLLHVELGFERRNLVTVSLNLPYQKYDQKRKAEVASELMERVRRMPGVREASASDYSPLEAVLFPYELRDTDNPAQDKLTLLARHVAPGYFQAVGIPLHKGRDFAAVDDSRTPVPALLNESAARRLFAGENPVGRRLTTQYRSRRVLEVVGVVGDARQLGLRQEPGFQLYLPLSYGSPQYVLARVASDPRAIAGAVRAAMREIAPDAPAPGIRTLDEMFDREIAQPRFYLALLGAFAAAGVALAAIGIYGVLSFAAARRTREIGIRMALGGERRDILRMVAGHGMMLAGIGAVVGVAGAFALSRFLAKMLYGVRPNDPATLACGTVLLMGIAALACYVPARRATKIDPMEALRYE